MTHKGTIYAVGVALIGMMAVSGCKLHNTNDYENLMEHYMNKYGDVKLPYMSELTGKNGNELYEELRGEIFWNPIDHKWDIRAKFICGIVVDKLENMKSYYEQAKDGSDLAADIQDGIEALEAAVPTPIPFEDLDFNLGERWV